MRAFNASFDDNTKALYDAYKDGTWRTMLQYRSMHKTNSNGKERDILSPSFVTRVFQWVAIGVLRPLYEAKDPHIALNCKEGCGIAGRVEKRAHGEKIEHFSRATRKAIKRNSVVPTLKHWYYDEHEYQYVLSIDQRKCYDHITRKAFRKAVKNLTTDSAFIDFATEVTFVGDTFPVGTPTSPIGHHIIMLPFDIWLSANSERAVRYADNVIVATRTKEEAHTLSWRIRNFWWYTLGIRAKRHEVRVTPMDRPIDFCGYIFVRHAKGKADHNKGVTRVRRSIVERAKRADNDKTWGAYFGILQHADTFRLMRNIEAKMKLSQLTERIRISRKLDAKNIDVKSLIGQTFTIYDYDLRADKTGTPNWIKCLIGIDEIDEDGQPTGRTLAREFHGGYMGLVEFITACEKEFAKADLLPIEEAAIDNQCGYIFENSTNQIQYINEAV